MSFIKQCNSHNSQKRISVRCRNEHTVRILRRCLLCAHRYWAPINTVKYNGEEDEVSSPSWERSIRNNQEVGVGYISCKVQGQNERTKKRSTPILAEKGQFFCRKRNIAVQWKRGLTEISAFIGCKERLHEIQKLWPRPLSVNLKKSYCGISERRILTEYSKSKQYQRTYPRFTNIPISRPVTTSKINERWQIDLVDMRNDPVAHNRKTYRYILSVVDVFSRFLIL